MSINTETAKDNLQPTTLTRGRFIPSPPPAHPGGGEVVSAWAYDWNAPKSAIGLKERMAEPVLKISPLARLIVQDAEKRRAETKKKEEEKNAEYQRAIAHVDPELVAQRRYLIEKAEERDGEQKEAIARALDTSQAIAKNPELAGVDALHTLPKHLKQPLLSYYNFLRKKQDAEQQDGQRKKPKKPATTFINTLVKQLLPRIEEIDRRNLTPAYRYFAGRERLEELLRLPELNKRRVRTLAALTAGAMDSHFDTHFTRHCAAHPSGDFTSEDVLRVYQAVAREALRINITPPCWAELNPDAHHRGETPYDLIPGALARLRCAQWWYRKLWQYRCIWREEQLRAASLVSRRTNAYISHDGLTERREQRRLTTEFRKLHQLANDDGFLLDMEDAYYAGNSNPKHRRIEMMTAMKGLQNIAELRGDTAAWCTVTCPSKYHATQKNGKPNPKWKAKTVRDSSNYLVDMFASVRKKLNRKKLYWYGIRVAEPHHDGTVHWHMMIFTRPEEREAIIAILQEFAIREDRAELGNNITPRFKVELITKEKGDPVSYIAKYIAKNLDGDPLRKPDPATGEHPTDHESGKSMAETVEHAISWASLHRIRQFQFFGIPSRQTYRELRRLAEQLARKGNNGRKKNRLSDPDMDDVLSAADAGCFATYILKQGGVLAPRKDHVVRTAYNEAEKPNDYGEHGIQIYGIWSPRLGEVSRICTHTDNWTLVRKASPADGAAARQGFDFDRQGAPGAPRTRGNNCPPEQNTNNPRAVFNTNNAQENTGKVQLPNNIEALSLNQRREMLKRMRLEPPARFNEKRHPRPPSRVEMLLKPEGQQQAEKLTGFAHSLDIDLSKAARCRLMLGEIVEIEDLRCVGGSDGKIRLAPKSKTRLKPKREPKTKPKSESERRDLLKQRIANIRPTPPQQERGTD